MKNLKALIKIERTPALVMSLYFLLLNVTVMIAMVGNINTSWKYYLARGIAGFDEWHIANNIYPMTLMLLLGYGVGMFVLVYLQFRKDKSIEISRFIKALPYTNGQRGAVKIGLGILSFTIPFIIYVLMFLMVRSYAMNMFSEILRVTAFEEISTYLNRPGVYLSFMGITYVRMIVIYLVFVMCEYLMSHNIGSLIVAVLSAAAPIYLYISNMYDVAYTSAMTKIGDWLYKVYIDYTEWSDIEIAGANGWDNIRYIVTEDGSMVLLIYLALIVICSLVIMMQIKKQRIENADIFMPGKVTRYVFIAGVAVCSACLVRDIGRIVLNQIVFGYSKIILYPFLAVGLILGGLIAMKITCIGMQRKKEV